MLTLISEFGVLQRVKIPNHAEVGGSEVLISQIVSGLEGGSLGLYVVIIRSEPDPQHCLMSRLLLSIVAQACLITFGR